MSGFCGMNQEGFLICPRCDHGWHGPICSEVSDTQCDCYSSSANLYEAHTAEQASIDRD